MKIVFFGTSAFAARLLADLIEHRVNIVAVVTKPDKPKGRSLSLTPPPVKEKALQVIPHIPLYQPPRASIPEFVEQLKTHSPDLFVVAAYGEIIKTNLLELPRLGCINVHASLLPKYRGASPIQRCLMNGETESGITIMNMVLEMDAGDILDIAKVPIPESMTFGELDLALSEAAAPLLLKVIKKFETGAVTRAPQEASQATFAPKLAEGEAQIDWSKPARVIHNQIRALSPFPGAWCWVQAGDEKKKMKIKRSEVSENSPILDKNQWIVPCGEGALSLLEVQLEGKKSLSIADFLRGLHFKISLI